MISAGKCRVMLGDTEIAVVRWGPGGSGIAVHAATSRAARAIAVRRDPFTRDRALAERERALMSRPRARQRQAGAGLTLVGAPAAVALMGLSGTALANATARRRPGGNAGQVRGPRNA